MTNEPQVSTSDVNSAADYPVLGTLLSFPTILAGGLLGFALGLPFLAVLVIAVPPGVLVHYVGDTVDRALLSRGTNIIPFDRERFDRSSQSTWWVRRLIMYFVAFPLGIAAYAVGVPMAVCLGVGSLLVFGGGELLPWLWTSPRRSDTETE